MDNIEVLAKQLKITKQQVTSVLNLLKEGSTIPFIARYRKEVTNNLDEEQIRIIEKNYEYLENLAKRKEDVIRLIKEKDLLTEELKEEILKCEKLSEVEDLYRPYKEKKKTKASEAIKLGLEPLAKMIMSFPVKGNLDTLTKNYPNLSQEEALLNSKYIISEWISDNPYYRKYIKNVILKKGFITSEKKKDANDEKKVYEMYYDFKESIYHLKHYRVLAMNRGEKQGILKLGFLFPKEEIFSYLSQKIIKNPSSFVCDIVLEAIDDALKRLIYPSVLREIWALLKSNADDMAILTFKDNLEHLLLTKPIKGKVVMGFDPAYRTGCKLAVLDSFGNVLEIATIYPHEPKNEKEKSKKILLDLIDKYHVDIIAIGNGTASRESEKFVADAIKGRNVLFNLVSEAGASVYSASPLAILEFPSLTVEKRSAISIGRRIQDPLSELVKIDPKSIGVGEYQHDVNQNELKSALNFTVSKIVNEIGVNINTASQSILNYISGLNKKTITSILNYRMKKPFLNREELLKLPGFSSKIYEQAIGFLRINDGTNPLDKTRIHPESYELTKQILNELNLDINNMDTPSFKKTLNEVNIKYLSDKLKKDEFTITDIIEELKNPGIDYRDKLDDVLLKSDILTIDDLKVGMKLQGTIRNVTSFGAFVDIGLHEDGLIHISKMSKNYVKDPKEIVRQGDIVDCYVIDISKEKQKVSLSLVGEN